MPMLARGKLKTSAVRAWLNFINSGFADTQEMRFRMPMVKFINFLSLITLTILFLFSFAFFVSHNYTKAAFLGTAALVSLGNIFLLRKLKSPSVSGITILLTAIFLVSFLFITGGFHETGIFWIFLFPLIAFHLRGRLEGILWVFVFLVITILNTWVFGIVLGIMNYSPQTLAHVFFSFMTVTLLGYLYEDKKEMDERLILNQMEHQRQAEDALRQSRERLRSVLNHSPVILYALDERGRVMLVEGRGLDRLTGIPTGLLIGRDFHTVFAAYPSLLHDLGRAFQGTAFNGELRLAERFFEAWYTPVFEDGNVCGVLGGLSDITDRKKSEIERELLATAVAQSAEAILVTDVDGFIEYVNPAFETITGYSRDEVMGRNTNLLKSNKHDAVFYAHLWRTLKAGQVWQGRFINRKKDGSLYEEEATISPVRNGSRQIINYVAVKRDVTREIQLQKQFLEAQKMEALGRLAGGIAHDFNNLLMVLTSSAEFASEEIPAGSSAANDIKEIIRSAKNAAALTRQLLAFSRKQMLSPQPVNLNDVVQDMNKMLKRLIGENIELVFSPGDDLGLVNADPGQMEQVIVNLAVNARDAMPNGGKLKVATTRVLHHEPDADTRREIPAGEYVKISILDTGTGMNDEQMSRIFEPFYTTKPLGKGTGLGLATVYGIVKQHQGHISVRSKMGEGTEFVILLPTAQGEPSYAPEPAPPVVARGGHETILVVEDDAAVRSVATRILRRFGYRVLEASNGRIALEVFEQHRDGIDLVLTDVVMPEMDGKALSDRLEVLAPDLTVLFSSGYPDSHIRDMGLLTSDRRLLPKPYDIAVLAGTVREMLDGRKQPRKES